MKENNTTITPESVLAAVKEMFAESDARFDRRMEEFDRRMEESSDKFDRRMKESSDKFDREMKESRAEFDRRSEEFDQRMKKFDQKMKDMGIHIGGVSNSYGLFAEEYFFNSFENGQQSFFGEEFDIIDRNVKGWKKGFMDEYDILMLNGHAVGIVEVKFRVDRDNIYEVIRKAETFRANFPAYQNHKIYLALATMVFNTKLEQECINEGIAVVKQVGDTITIYDEHIKAF